MFRIDPTVTREVNIAVAEVSAARAKKLYEEINALVEEGFKHVPDYTGTKAAQAKARSAEAVINRLRSEMSIALRIKSNYEHQDRMAKEKAERELADHTKRQREDESRRLLNDAVQYLLNNGKRLISDFRIENAIAEANQLAFELEVARREGENAGPIEFSGDGSCEDCSGWIPGEHRCECGNRRVSWSEGYGHSFQSPSIYAEAY